MPFDAPPQINVGIPEAFLPLFWKSFPDGSPLRYKCFYGGRSSGKSTNLARALVAEAYTEPHLVLCTREYQNTIADSVYRVLQKAISDLQITPYFIFLDASITCRLTGSQFIFKGLRRDIQGIRSLEGVTRCWIEEAHWLTQDSWLILDPTIRTAGSQIFVSYNPVNDGDPTHRMFALKTPEQAKAMGAYVAKVGWQDNPFITPDMERLRLNMMLSDPDNYDWVWEGHTRKISNATIFKDKVEILDFDVPKWPLIDRFYFGLDWGFANDPLAAIRCWILDNCLYVDHEFFGINVEIDQVRAALYGEDGFHGIPGAEEGFWKADNARPECISFVARQGVNMSAAEKWPGSVEDGILHLKAFKKIYIHPRCTNMVQESRLYSYKTDDKVLDANGNPLVLAKVEDKHNHGFDALRYALDGYIQKRGGLAQWEALA